MKLFLPEELEQLITWIKIKCGGSNYTIDEIVEAYQGLMEFNGYDPNKPPVGLDLVGLTIRNIYELGVKGFLDVKK